MTNTYTEQQRQADKEAGRPVDACPECGKRANVALIRQFGCCLTCRVARG